MTHHPCDHHDHEHNAQCGHTRIQHHDHVDYVHDGQLHHKHEDHWDTCRIEVSAQNPDSCQPVDTTCLHHANCGHPQVPHGDHVDYLVDGRLQHVHNDHVDDHGPVTVLD